MTSTRLTILISGIVIGAALLSSTGVIRIGADRDAMIVEGERELDGELTPIPEVGSIVNDDGECSMREQITTAMTLLADVTLDVGVTDISYSEVRNGTKKIFNDPEKEFALVVLHQKRCELELITITKRGDELVPPSGWAIEVVRRPSGIRWNNWNTEFRITQPDDAVVIANVEPFIIAERAGQRVTNPSGRVKTVYTTSRAIEYRSYVPYSHDLHSKELVEFGETYLNDVVARAFSELRDQGVYSRVFPERLIVELPSLSQGMFARLPLIEQVDLLEFVLDPNRVVERVFVLLGGNVENAFTFTCSHAGACGLMQFTDAGGNGTYSLMRSRYPDAELNLDFELGAKDHLNAMKAAILLHDNNLVLLTNSFGDDIVQDPRLEEYLAALYNASPASVIPAIRAARQSSSADWSDHLPDRIQRETGGYIAKLRYLQKRAEQLAVTDSVHPAQ